MSHQTSIVESYAPAHGSQRLGVSLLALAISVSCLGILPASSWAAPPGGGAEKSPVAATDKTAASAVEFPPELVEFTEYAHNPIFTAEGPGHWDVKMRERGWILRDGDHWRLWYDGYDGTREGLKMLGTATSPDALHWTPDPHNPIYKDHWVEDMMVVHRGGKWYMFAEGLDDLAHWLTSDDGVHWHREGLLDIRLANGKPISPGPRGTPTVWYEDGTWYLIYERGDRGGWLARSKDLKVWTNVQDDPVLLPGPAAYDRLLIAVNQVIQSKGRYYAYYHGTGDSEKPRRWSTDVAMSTDRIHWKKYPGNPIVPGDRSSGIVVEVDGRWRLYTMHDAVRVYLPRQK